MAASQPAELVHLSVGGSAFTTTRTTLCAQPGTLAAMFSGEAQPTLLKDAEGRFFMTGERRWRQRRRRQGWAHVRWSCVLLQGRAASVLNRSICLDGRVADQPSAA